MIATAAGVGNSVNTVYLIIGIIVGGIGIAGYLRTALRNEVRVVMKEVKPNGGDTNSLGDTAKRTEIAFTDHALKDLRVQKRLKREVKVLRKELRAIGRAIGVSDDVTIGSLAHRAEDRRLEAIEPSHREQTR
jgi:hypothetical protein